MNRTEFYCKRMGSVDDATGRGVAFMSRTSGVSRQCRDGPKCRDLNAIARYVASRTDSFKKQMAPSFPLSGFQALKSPYLRAFPSSPDLRLLDAYRHSSWSREYESQCCHKAVAQARKCPVGQGLRPSFAALCGDDLRATAIDAAFRARHGFLSPGWQSLGTRGGTARFRSCQSGIRGEPRAAKSDSRASQGERL